MKYFKILLSVIASILILQGCGLTQPPAEEVEDTPELTMKEQVEDFGSYTEVEELRKRQMAFPPDGCIVYQNYLDRVESGEIETDAEYEEAMEAIDWEKYIEFSEKIVIGEVKMKEMFSGVGTSLYLVLTPRYDYMEEDREEMNKCIEGVGYLSLFKIFDDNILWGRTECTGGAVPMEDEVPGITKAIEDCKKVREELLKYKSA